jgi:predicted transcriptional regulator
MKNETRYEARGLRQEGMSVKEIAKVLGVSRSSVSLWVRDIELTDAQKQALKDRQRLWGAQNSGAHVNREKARQVRIVSQEVGRAKAKENRPLHHAGCMLYWAEGAKSRNNVNFVNSDPNMSCLFMRFLREELDVKDAEIALYIHCHSTANDEIERVKQYWLDLLTLPASCIRKVLYKKGSEVRKNILKNGVCSIRVYSTDLVQHIYGAIQEYGGFDNPDWLF